MAKEVEGSLDLSRLQLKWGITAVNHLKATWQDKCCGTTAVGQAVPAASKESLLTPATDYCPASLTGG